MNRGTEVIKALCKEAKRQSVEQRLMYLEAQVKQWESKTYQPLYAQLNAIESQLNTIVKQLKNINNQDNR